jgi:hypothetical protein
MFPFCSYFITSFLSPFIRHNIIDTKKCWELTQRYCVRYKRINHLTVLSVDWYATHSLKTTREIWLPAMSGCSAELRHLSSLHVSIIPCTILITNLYICIRSLIFWKFLTQRRWITHHQERCFLFIKLYRYYKAKQTCVSAVFTYWVMVYCREHCWI